MRMMLDKPVDSGAPREASAFLTTLQCSRIPLSDIPWVKLFLFELQLLGQWNKESLDLLIYQSRGAINKRMET